MAEKLLYLQNGVYKRKELTSGLQYYANNAFQTIPMPTTNGTYVISFNNNVLSLVEGSAVNPDEPETPTFTSIDNSYFKGTDGQAIPIAERGTIPYFKTQSQFGGINLPSAGTYVLTTDGTTPALAALTEAVVLNGIGYDSTSNRYVIANWNSNQSNHKDLLLPNKSGSFMLSCDNSSNYEFVTLSPKSLFNENFGISSGDQTIVGYWGEYVYGLTVPTDNGYSVFHKTSSASMPTMTNLTSQIIYRDILGCTSSEKCIPYNNGNTVSKLAMPTTSGEYVLKVDGTGAYSLALPTTRVAFNYDVPIEGAYEVTTETITTSGTATLVAGKQYALSVDVVMRCDDYEPAIEGFASNDMPIIAITWNTSTIINATIANPQPYTYLSGTTIIEPSINTTLSLNVQRNGSKDITHYYERFHISVHEV